MNRENQEMREFNIRQIKLIEKKIDEYKNDNIPIGLLISNLETLLNYIQMPPQELIKKILDLVWNMEVIYSWALSKERSMTKEELAEINEHIKNISELLCQYEQNNIQKDF